MHGSLIIKTISVLLIIIALFMLLPIIVALVDQEPEMIDDFLLPALIAIILCGTIILVTRKIRGNLSSHDGFFLVSMSWVLASALGALPFVLSGAIPHYYDAFFETMSGFTTTGASILTEIESLPRSILFWRSLTHWLGGMGIIVLTVAVFPLLGIGGAQIMKAESPGPELDRITSRISHTAKILWIIYFGMTVAQTLLLLMAGLDLFEALTHTFGTLATGGFSPKNASVGHYSSPLVQWIITVFMVMAGVNFVLYYRLITGKVLSVFKNTELRTYLIIFLLATGIITANLWTQGYSSGEEALRLSAFQAASILTTTGYATDNFALWPAFGQAILFALMFIGGCAGSTGGGMKVIRVLTVLKQGFNEMKYFLHHRGVFSFRINNTPVKKNVVYTISGFVALYLLLIILTTLVVSFAGNDLVTSLSTALATLGNIGPGFGLIGPVENYAFYPPWLKWYLSFIMMVGRLEVYTVLVIFTRSFWRR